MDYFTLEEIKKKFPINRKNGYSYFVDESIGIEKIQLYKYRKSVFEPGKYYLTYGFNIATKLMDNCEFQYGQMGVWLGHKWGHFKTLKEAVDFLSKCINEYKQGRERSRI